MVDFSQTFRGQQYSATHVLLIGAFQFLRTLSLQHLGGQQLAQKIYSGGIGGKQEVKGVFHLPNNRLPLQVKPESEIEVKQPWFGIKVKVLEKER